MSTTTYPATLTKEGFTETLTVELPSGTVNFVGHWIDILPRTFRQRVIDANGQPVTFTESEVKAMEIVYAEYAKGYQQQPANHRKYRSSCYR